MYQVRPENINSFIDDHTIKFPRFQRKQTWKYDKNIKLAISVFKTYPIGVTIINKQIWKKTPTRWLLDGRQRRNALLLMSQNPENIYDWAKIYLKIKNSDQSQDIARKFWEKIGEFLNDSNEEGFMEAKFKAIEAGESEFYFDGKTYKTISNTPFHEDDNDQNSFDDNDDEAVAEDIGEVEDHDVEFNKSIKGNLDELLFIIRIVHIKSNSRSGYSSPFDFRKIIKNLSYAADGNSSLSGQKLTTFIKEYLNYLFEHNLDEESKKSLLEFYKSRYSLDIKQSSKISNVIDQQWEDIKNSILAVKIIKNRLKEAIIGIIETENITATDSQMIFMLINKEGSKLTAVEILSAKPSWNIEILTPSADVKKYSSPLYAAINTKVENTVKWDYPATLYDRLDELSFILPKLDYTKSTDLEKKLTLGFKILSGIYRKGIKKEDVDLLAIDKEINWETDIDQLIKDLNLMGKVLNDSPYFKYLKSWKQTFLGLTSDAIALNFIFTTYADFKRKKYPAGNSSKAKVFINNAIILADKSIFEYVTQKWRGSSDSKISKNINSFYNIPDKFTPLDDTIWLKLNKEINDNQTIEDDIISFSISKTLVFHTYCVHSIMGPDSPKIDIDHIIPQSLFNGNGNILNAVNIKNALFNLSPLPSKDNIKKTNKTLQSITDPWLIQQIERYTKISPKKFVQFSDVNSWEKLREERRKFFEEDFIKAKNKIIS
jgi:hypothetical protein